MELVGKLKYLYFYAGKLQPGVEALVGKQQVNLGLFNSRPTYHPGMCLNIF